MDVRSDDARVHPLLMPLASDGTAEQQTRRDGRREQKKIPRRSIFQAYLQTNVHIDCVAMVERKGRRDEGNAAGSCESGVNVQVIVRCRYVGHKSTTQRRIRGFIAGVHARVRLEAFSLLK